MKKLKLEKINELVEKIKAYGNDISVICDNIDIDLESTYEDENILFIGLTVCELLLEFKVDEYGTVYIDISDDEWEPLDEILFWQTMYFKSRKG